MKSFIITLLVFISTSTFAAKCPAKIAGSCLTAGEGMSGCLDLVSNTVPVDQFKAQCNSQHGKFSASACSVNKLAGSCIVPFGQQDGMITRFYAPVTADMVSMICQGMAGKTCN